MTTVRLQPHDMAHGGEAVARHDGKAHFVAGALPGDTVDVEITRDKGNWARGRLVEVVTPSPDRITPRCRHFDVCGGCNWQMADVEAQRRYKRDSVAGQLAHLGGVDDPQVRDTVATGADFGYRNRMDFRVLGGRVALGRRGSNDTVALDECHLLHPGLVDVFDGLGDLSGVERITLRISEATGDRLVIVDGTVPDQASTWNSAVARRKDRRITPVIGEPHLFHEVGGRRYRVSGAAFFQVNTSAAAALVTLVAEALDPERDDVLLDAYAGGGLFAVAVGGEVGSVLAVELDDAAASDLRHNLTAAGIDAHEVIQGDTRKVLRNLVGEVDLAVVDPPRVGLGADVINRLSEWAPRTLAYVSCDPASLARDVRSLAGVGYRLEWATPVDMFPQTHHIETVARLVR